MLTVVQTRRIEKGICEINSGCGCPRYCSYEIVDSLRWAFACWCSSSQVMGQISRASCRKRRFGDRRWPPKKALGPQPDMIETADARTSHGFIFALFLIPSTTTVQDPNRGQPRAVMRNLLRCPRLLMQVPWPVKESPEPISEAEKRFSSIQLIFPR